MRNFDLKYLNDHEIPCIDLVIPAFKALKILEGSGKMQDIMNLIIDANSDSSDFQKVYQTDLEYWLTFALIILAHANMVSCDYSLGPQHSLDWLYKIQPNSINEIIRDPIEVVRRGKNKDDPNAENNHRWGA